MKRRDNCLAHKADGSSLRSKAPPVLCCDLLHKQDRQYVYPYALIRHTVNVVDCDERGRLWDQYHEYLDRFTEAAEDLDRSVDKRSFPARPIALRATKD